MVEAKIGLEIHCQLTGLESKLFCPCKSDYRGEVPNTTVCPICLGLPGTLPLLNQRAVAFACMISLSLGCKVQESIMFYRKNYFYLDLPKNFQITQYNAYGITSIGAEGNVDLGTRSIKIRRVQLEEDPGRLVYENADVNSSFYTLIDYNRAGVALVEIVTEPDFDNPKDVRIFLDKVTSTIEHLGVCDIRLDGSLRCDVNVSIKGGKKVEIKNINSFRDVEKALAYEIARQKTMSIREIEVKSETRHWDDARKITIQSRSKEEEQDYRYFPEPDIPTIILGDQFISSLRVKMPELPDERKIRFLKDYTLSDHVAKVLINNKELADFFESTVRLYPSSPNEIANWIISDLLGLVDDSRKEERSLLPGLRIEPKHIAELVKMIDQNKINRNIAKSILSQIARTGEMPSYVLDKMNASIIDSESKIAEAIDSIFELEISAVRDAKHNPNAANFLLGKVMQLTKGRADPKITLNLIKARLAKMQ